MRKLFSCLLALVLTVGVTGTIITPASATSRPELVETDIFYVYKGGGPAVSNKFMKKTDNSDGMYTEVTNFSSSIKWLSSEVLYWRGRSESLARATELGTTNEPTWRGLSYLSGYGTYGSKYTVAAQYADSNPYTHLEVLIAWIS